MPGVSAIADGSLTRHPGRRKEIELARRILKVLLVVGPLLGIVFLFWRQPRPASPGPVSPISSHAQARDGSSAAASDAGHERKMLQSLLEKKPGHVPVLMRLASLAGDMKKSDEAIRYLREIIRVEPANIDARLELSRVMFDAGDIAGAIGMNSEILRLQPGSVDALYNLGAIYGNLGNYELALQNWKKAVASAPNSASGKRAQEMLAVLHKESRR